MILFVDFDGVLHPQNKGAVFSCASVLWALLRQHPELIVVISSSWRWDRSIEDLIRLMTANGGEDLVGRIVGSTPKLRHTKDAGSRQIECEAWLKANGLSEMAWLALDDMPELFEANTQNLYQVDARCGLVAADIARISAFLQNYPRS